jgi:carbon-monoxide dehydrogenase medium subunit
VRLPVPRPGAAICEFARRHGDFAIVAVAAAVSGEGGVCRDARVVLGGVAGTVQRAAGAEAVLVGSGLDAGAIAAAAEEAAAGTDPPGDVHGSAEYRRHLVRVLAARAIEEAAEDA